ncbi:acyl-CoA thioesterase [Tsukamurella soli]|uniref:Acyl-CoA thioesterase n=1 Tax=Tsukamurella soli TaxID=644556 RepID=A0ABP8KBP8_9ACTN
MAKQDVAVAMRWSDMDVNAHVNNVVLMRYLEEARIRFMIDLFGVHTGPDAILVAHQEMDYIKPLLYSVEPLRMSVWITRLGRSGFDIGYEIWDESGDLCALAEVTLVTIHAETQRPCRIPEDMRAALDPALGERVPLRRRVKGE